MIVGFGAFAIVGTADRQEANQPRRLDHGRGRDHGWHFPAGDSYAAYVMTTSRHPDALALAGTRAQSWYWYVLIALSGLVIVAMPTAIGVAVLRYRLYDIDLVVSRTLVYGTLTASLVMIYLGGVVLLQYVFRVLTERESQLAVVASTLVIAALFNPLRRRIQSFIDRRFYRRKYDAARTLRVFSSKLREETNLDRLGGELVSVVKETMQPQYASLWLRPPGRRERREREVEDV